MSPGGGGGSLEVRNEFAAVVVRLNTAANSARLEICDLESGRWRALDAYALRSLVLAPAAAVRALCAATVPQDPPGDPGPSGS